MKCNLWGFNSKNWVDSIVKAVIYSVLAWETSSKKWKLNFCQLGNTLILLAASRDCVSVCLYFLVWLVPKLILLRGWKRISRIFFAFLLFVGNFADITQSFSCTMPGVLTIIRRQTKITYATLWFSLHILPVLWHTTFNFGNRIVSIIYYSTINGMEQDHHICRRKSFITGLNLTQVSVCSVEIEWGRPFHFDEI